ncbi:transmembrane protein, putative (macronuclear) [Tetrahymena thermophila SB210]|uniref:Transmembrane protein, putative n=1 Tax=Tetrahymena thermophila (strain SB210) TaxID=312017 RepID=Q22Y12_TETTS|nr:transmembrane protein, putative [Tetrahymena thermophila SB210]EAR90212.1 transmembrane protein, putative [Tetrahymena thermophila SB210]|eukprot:XP_001010457.1 transmembrane protein, putative [Tetrahymena thermophila SB210]
MCFKYLSKIDIFGSRITLRFKGESTYKSKLGSTVTLCIFGIIAFRLISIIISIYQRKNPILTYQERQVDNPAQFIANSMTFPFAFAMQDPVTKNYYVDESIYTATATLMQKYLVFNQNTQQYVTVWNNTEIPVQRCTKENFQNQENANYFLKLNYTNMYCFPPDAQISIQGDFPSPILQQIKFTLQQCLTNCKSPNELNYYLMKSGIGLQLSDAYVDPNIKDNPFKMYSRDMYFPISKLMPKDVFINIRNNYVYSDFGWFTSDIINQVFPSYSFYEDFVYPADFQNYYLSVTIRLEKQKENVFQRSYPKFTDVISQIGGFSQTLLAIGFIICNNFSQLQLNQQIINSVFNYDETRTTDQQKQRNIQQKQVILKQQNIGQSMNLQDRKNEQNLSSSKQKSKQENKNSLQEQNNQQVQIPQSFLQKIDQEQTKLQNVIPEQSTPLNTSKNMSYQQQKFSQFLQEQMEGDKSTNINDRSKKHNRQSKFQEKQKKYQKEQIFKENQFDELIQKETKSMKMNLWEYFKSLIYPCGYLKDKKQIINYSIEKLYYNLDIMQILKRLIEVEKLKRLLLDQDQIRLFDYLPKPTINPDLVFKSQNNQNSLKSQEIDLLYSDNRSELQKTREAFKAYQQILSKQNNTYLDQKILETLDPNLVAIFNAQFNNYQDAQQEKISSKHNQELFSDYCLLQNQNTVKTNSPNNSFAQQKIIFQNYQKTKKSTLISSYQSSEQSPIQQQTVQQLILSRYQISDEVNELNDIQNLSNQLTKSQQNQIQTKDLLNQVAQEGKYDFQLQKLLPFENQKLSNLQKV